MQNGQPGCRPVTSQARPAVAWFRARGVDGSLYRREVHVAGIHEEVEQPLAPTRVRHLTLIVNHIYAATA